MTTPARQVRTHLVTVVVALAVALGLVAADAGVVTRPGELPIVRIH